MKIIKIVGVVAATLNLAIVVYGSVLIINCIARQQAPVWLTGVIAIAIIISIICFAHSITPKEKPLNNEKPAK